jgi:hypothetical protein
MRRFGASKWESLSKLTPTFRENNDLCGRAWVSQHPIIDCFLENRYAIITPILPALITQGEVIMVPAGGNVAVSVCDVDFASNVKFIIRADLVPTVVVWHETSFGMSAPCRRRRNNAIKFSYGT